MDDPHTQERMKQAVLALKKTLAGLRTGRASPALLEPLIVEAYGAKTPLSQLGMISAPEPQLLVIQVWDVSVMAAISKAIQTVLSLTTMIDGDKMRIRLPELTQERRAELAKTLKRYAEETRVGVRTIRREAVAQVDALEKKKELSEDEGHIRKKDIQKVTDLCIQEVDNLIAQKEKELMTL